MKKLTKPLIVGNWKTNPPTLDSAKNIFRSMKRISSTRKDVEVVICPPAPFISELSDISGIDVSHKNKRGVSVGAQDVSIYSEGSHTGEASASMLESSGACYVIVGHSERRAAGETDTTISMKIAQVLKTRMTAILCVGEKIRDEGGEYLTEIQGQIRAALAGLTYESFSQIIIAYEPVWAIGRQDNSAMSAHDLHQMVLYIRKFLHEKWGESVAKNVPILYGGSVFNENAYDILWNGEANGLLVGRASWTVESFSALLKAIDAPAPKEEKRELKSYPRKTVKAVRKSRPSKMKKVKGKSKTKKIKKAVRKSVKKPVKKISKKGGTKRKGSKKKR